MRTEETYQVFSTSTFKKIIAALLACVLLCGTLASCGGDEEQTGEDTTAPAEESVSADSTDESEADGEKVVIASKGDSVFTIWVESNIYANYPDIVKQINDVVTLIKNKTGATIAVMSDSSYSVKASKKPGILIGNTKFAESQAMQSDMKNKDYYVGLSGDKILLYGGDVGGVEKAIRFFYITVLNSQKVVDNTMYFDTSIHTLRQTETYDINSIKCAGVELGKFDIVLSPDAATNESYFAKSLRYWLYLRYGYRMNLSDGSVAAENSIVIENAEVSGKDYAIRVEDGDLYLTADCMLGFNAMYDYITGTLFKAGGSVDYTLAADYSHSALAPTSINDGTSLIGAKTGTVRLMINNVFSNIVNYDDGTSTGPIPLRQALQLEMVRSYAPDIVGFQEFSTNYDSVVAQMTELGYELVPNNSTVRNNNPLFFNNDTLELIDSGYKVYTGIEEQKAAAWAVFEVRDSGERFVAISTHFMWNSPKFDSTDEAVAARNQNAVELLALVDQIRDEYTDIPVLMGGDFNCQLTSDALTSILDEGFSCARELAAQKNDTNGSHTYSRYDPEFEAYTLIYTPTKKHSAAIDHVFVSGNVTINSFASLTIPYACYASDHCPMITDFTIN